MEEIKSLVEKIWKVRIPLTTGRESRTYKFIGAVELIIDEFNVIYDWQMSATNIRLDRMSDRDWFDKMPAQFYHREEIFFKAGIQRQFERPNNSKNGFKHLTEMTKFNQSGIDAFIAYVNNHARIKREEWLDLPSIFTGTSRSLSQAHERDELLYTDYKGKPIPVEVIIKNFLLNATSTRKADKIKEILDSALVIEEMDFSEWCDANPKTLGKWAEMLTETYDFPQTINEISAKVYKESESLIKKTEKIDVICQKHSEKFERSIIDTYGYENPFFKVDVVEEDEYGESFVVQEEFHRVHIYPIWRIKKDMINADSKEELEALASQVSDIENFIPLNTLTKNLFERGNVYYDNSGYMRVLFKTTGRALPAFGYHQLDEKFLSDKKKEYFEKHRHLNVVDPFKKIAVIKAAEAKEIGDIR